MRSWYLKSNTVVWLLLNIDKRLEGPDPVKQLGFPGLYFLALLVAIRVGSWDDEIYLVVATKQTLKRRMLDQDLDLDSATGCSFPLLY